MWILLPLGIAALGWAIWGFPVQRVNTSLIVLSIVTIFFSSYLRIQLPRTKIHLTISDALIFLSLLIYGGEIAVLLAILETTFTSLNFRRQGVAISLKTVAINVLIAAVSGLVTALAVGTLFGTPEEIMAGFGSTSFVWALGVMALSQFLVNSVLVSAVIAIKSESTLWKVWNDYCLNALVIYLSGAAMAGISAKALVQINVFLFAAVCGFFALVYFTYRRYVDDVKVTAAQAEEAERNRADQAEKHVVELEHYVGELEKSTEALRVSREKFRHAAYHDKLTGLPNRNRFLDALNSVLVESRSRPDDRFAILFLDLNRFKMLNDSLGHSVGDTLIVDVAERLSKIVREADTLARFSGDEYAILLTNIKEPGEVVTFADRVASELAEPFTLNGRQVFTSVSIGIAIGNPRYEKGEEILRDADIAMYYAKEKQKNYVVFDREMHTKAVSLMQLETDLRLAVEREEFEIYYQPIVNLDEARLIGFEALVRWNHPERGQVPPFEFIDVAESTGLIIPMTVWIMRNACRQIVEWERKTPDDNPLIISINLSVKHFTHPGLVEQVLAILNETGMNPYCLKLEMTESAVMENAETAIEMLRKIKTTGVKVSIDDFGTGYSSLSYLHRFPIDTLKIDRSFVSTMEEGSENGEIVRTVIALAKALKLSVVAEGIESIHQFHQLRILGCQYGQGYLFSRPLPAKEIEKLLFDRLRWQNILPPNEIGIVAQNLEYTHLRLPQ